MEFSFNNFTNKHGMMKNFKELTSDLQELRNQCCFRRKISMREKTDQSHRHSKRKRKSNEEDCLAYETRIKDNKL